MSEFLDTDLRFSIVPEWILDAGLSDRAIRIYALIARYADNETLQAFPSRETLAKRANCHVKTVDRAIRQLVEVGALQKSHRIYGDAYRSNLYTVRRIPPKRFLTTLETSVSPGRDNDVARLGTPVSPGGDTDVALTITSELEPLEPKPNNDIARKFDQFWEAYPKKKGKGQARKAFERALKKTDMETLLEGVSEYVRNSRWEDEQFIAYPATWLNGERWTDEYDSPAVRETPGPGRREWVKPYHKAGQHWACNPNEFPEGCH